MNYLTYIFRFLYRIRYWLILCPLLVALIVYVKLGSAPRKYSSTSTIYTGIVSGYDIESGQGQKQDWNIINNAVDNLINIITSQTTLKNVSMQLYAQDLSYGQPDRDNSYMTARSYRILENKTPQEVLDLVDRTDDSVTLANLWRYEQRDRENHVYGMFLWNHRHYSYDALRKIKVKRLGSSDMLEVSYTNDDPGIVYNTLLLLNQEFVRQYRDLRFGETNDVIAYFEKELARVNRELHDQEDSLTQYNVANHIIHYDEQTRHIAALTRDYELKLQDILLDYNSSRQQIETIEKKIEPLKTFRNNALFLQKLHEISDRHYQIAAAEAFQTDSLPKVQTPGRAQTHRLKFELDSLSRDLQQITADIALQQYTKEGLSTPSMISEWLNAVLLFEQSSAKLEVMKAQKEKLDRQYELFSPIGSTLNRKERNIQFLKENYLSILHALNSARLKQKSLQMSSATLKIINPPVLPLSPEPSKRKLMVITAFLGTLFFILGFFILLELLDRTLRDKIRTERITGGRVLGAFPGAGTLRARRYTRTYQQAAARYLSNAVLNYFRPESPNVINVLSTEPGDGKSLITEQLAAHMRETGLAVRVVSWNRDFNPDSKEFLLAHRLGDFARDRSGDTPLADADVVLVEYPPLARCSVPKDLLRSAALNLMVVRANRVWKDTDQTLFDKTVALSDQTPVMLYLNKARREVVETFTGLLPPYSRLRKLGYRFYQFGFTSVDR